MTRAPSDAAKFTKFTMSRIPEPCLAARRQSRQSRALGARYAALAVLAAGAI
jgi:hypothetical protein